MQPINRRTFIRAAGVGLALPMLESMTSPVFGGSNGAPPKRMVMICTSLGLHGPSLFPKKQGPDYETTPYLKSLEKYRNEFTLFSGLSHPEQAGADGHSSQMTWLTAARHPGLGGFRNSISVDQFAREKLGFVTRFPSITLCTEGATSQSYTRSGVMIPAEDSPARLFEKLFLQGKPEEIRRQREKLHDGNSILDSLRSETKALGRRVSKSDQLKLDEYFESLRQTEQFFTEADAWMQRPKPKVSVEQPVDIAEANDLIGRTNLLMKLIPLIVQTDSSRMISVLIQGRNDVPLVAGVDIDHHNLSHHGQDEKKLAQLAKIENELMKSFGNLLGSLKDKKEQGRSLLDNSMVLFGSNLGNANSHDWRNLPILLAGGDFKHGQHVGFDRENNIPLCNLFVSMLQKAGIDTEQFGSSTGSLTW